MTGKLSRSKDVKDGEAMPEESRLELKIDELLRKQAETSERLAIVETLVKERTDDNKEVHDKLKSLEDRMTAFEKHKTQAVTVKDILIGAAMLGLMAWEAIK